MESGIHKSRRASAAASVAASSMTRVNEHSTRGPNGSRRISKPPIRVAEPPPRDSSGRLKVLQKSASLDADEVYGEQERALSQFLRLHPMLSLETTSHRTLQLIADLIKESDIPTKELEVVSKTHDDAYLCPADTSIGERPCCLADRCICVWLARWRYGEDTEYAFIGKEFLLPSQRTAFETNGALPPTHGKCLLCTRYHHTFLYRLARSDPTFKPSESIPLQAFGNSLGLVKGESVPSHSSVVGDVDGYKQEALLFVDEAWSETHAARGSMGTLLWRPCVKFCSSDYKYCKDPSTGTPRMIQVEMGVVPDNEAGATHFRQPTLQMATEMSA